MLLEKEVTKRKVNFSLLHGSPTDASEKTFFPLLFYSLLDSFAYFICLEALKSMTLVFKFQCHWFRNTSVLDTEKAKGKEREWKIHRNMITMRMVFGLQHRNGLIKLCSPNIYLPWNNVYICSHKFMEFLIPIHLFLQTMKLNTGTFSGMPQVQEENEEREDDGEKQTHTHNGPMFSL